MPAKKISHQFGTQEQPIVIAHRGCSDEAPENSLAAFRKAIDAGANMIELDVRLSADHHFTVFHDVRLQRTSNGRGPLNNFGAAALTQFDNGSWFSSKFSKERIPLLADVFPLVKEGTLLNIEIKPDVISTNGTTAAAILLELARKARVLSRIIFTSFNHKIVKEIKSLDDSVVSGIIYHPLTNFRKSPAQLAALAHADVFVCSKYQVNGDVVADAQKSGYKVYVYGIKTERDVKRMLHLDVEGMITNNPLFVQKTIHYLRSAEL